MLKKRILICLLTLLLIFSSAAVISSCNKKTNPTDSGETVSTSGDDTSNDIPDYDFGGVEYNILSRSSTSFEFDHAKSTSSDIVNSAVFARNAVVMDKFNVVIKTTPIAGDWGNKDSFITALRNLNSVFDTTYSLVAGHMPIMVNAMFEGFGYNMNSLPNVDLNKRWWCEEFTDIISIDGKTYFALGDIAYTLYSYMIGFFVNDTMLADNSLESVFDLVNQGKWTFETMKQYALSIESDVYAEAGSRNYGLLTNTHAVRSFVTSFDIQLAVKGTDGKYFFPVALTDRSVTVIENVYDFLKQNTVDYNASDHGTYSEMHNPIFTAGHGLFYMQTLAQANVFAASMTQEYSVVPFPKYDSEQIDYVTPFNDGLTAVMVPKYNKGVEMIGTITEALCMESYKHITPAYYENALKRQSFNNAEVLDMLDMVRLSIGANFIMPFSTVLTTAAGGTYPYSLMQSVYAGGVSYSTTYTKYQASYQKSLENIYEKYAQFT